MPPDPARLVSDKPAGPTRNAETSFEPAFTAKSQRPSSLRASAPCEPSPLPVPVPPVAALPAAASMPSAARLKTATAFPDVWLVSAYTAPGPEPSAAASAVSRAASDAAERGLVVIPPFSEHAARATAASAARAICLFIGATSREE